MDTNDIVLVILEDPQGLILLQLRSQKAGIANPGQWGLFGGHVEPGEDPEAAAIREIKEELSIDLNPSKLRLVREFDRRNVDFHYFLYHYPLDNEMHSAHLNEGERFAAATPDSIRLGRLEGASIVAHHLEEILRLWGAA